MCFKVLATIRLWMFLLGMTFSFTVGVWWCRYLIPPLGTKTLCGQIRLASPSRPQSLQEELGTRRLLFIGVMTSQKFLTTRARGVYETWGKNAPGKLVFFAGMGKTQPTVNFPVVYLPVPDNVHPPQRKSLAMLKFIYNNYIDNFKWFIRADDDVYIRTGKLIAFLQKLNSSESILLGQAGLGKGDERGKLGLRDGDNFCMGGPGVIMSREVLKKVKPHLVYCLNNTATFHEDTEVGRCLRNFAGVMCPWAYQAKELFHQVYDNQAEAYHGDLSTAAITNAITLHPIKDPAYMRRLHIHYLTKESHTINHKAWLLKHQLQNLKKAAAVEKPSQVFRGNVDFFGDARNNSSWETFSARQIFSVFQNAPLHWIHDSTRDGLVNVVREGKKLIEADGASLKYHSLRFAKNILGYLQVSPKLGAQYIIHISSADTIRSNQDVKPKLFISKHSLKFQQPFEMHLKYRQIDTGAHETVHFVVPLAGRLENFRRFLASFENAFLLRDKKIKLLVVYFPKLKDPSKHKAVLRMYKRRHPQDVFHWLNVKTDTFQRSLALNIGSKYFGRNVLLSFVDVDLVFETEFLFRCRGNTKRGEQVYFPIMFSKFNPNISHTARELYPFTFHKDAGLWRFYSYGPVCVYSDDVNTVGGFNTTIRGWGLEDIEFFEKIIKHGKMKVIRAPDRGLVHVFHKHAPCSAKSTFRQQKMCHDAKYAYLSSASSALEYLIKKRYLKTNLK